MSRKFVFVANSRSGSFDQDKVDEILARANALGLGEPHPVYLPDAEAPTAGSVDKDDVIAVFGGDGTIGSVVRGLADWDGAVLVLPGGTMNLASKRLHGDVDSLEILEAIAAGKVRRTRPNVVRTDEGDSLAGVMVGPGTSWSDVREAMRDVDIANLAASTVRAFATTGSAAKVACLEPALGRAEGYPMIEVLPTSGGMEISGYHADDLGQFAVGLAALLRHDFRSGPCEAFEIDHPVVIGAVNGSPVGVLIDGDAVDERDKVALAVGPSRVDLLVTAPDA